MYEPRLTLYLEFFEFSLTTLCVSLLKALSNSRCPDGKKYMCIFNAVCMCAAE